MEIENGMVLGGAAEWERMNADTPYDNADAEDFEAFAWGTDRMAEALITGLALDDGAVTEDAAKEIYQVLSAEIRKKIMKKWSKDVDPIQYNEWYEK